MPDADPQDYFFTPADFGQEIKLEPGVRIRVLARGSLMFSLVEIDDGVTTSTHSHPEEQMGIVLDGAFDRVQGDERRVLEKGDGFYVPPNMEHGGTAAGGPCRLLDVFTPPRPLYLYADE